MSTEAWARPLADAPNTGGGITGSDREPSAVLASGLQEPAPTLASERDAPATEARTSLVVVDWEFQNGIAGHRICTDPDAARMAALGIIDAHPDARVWLAGVQVQQGWVTADDRSRA